MQKALALKQRFKKLWPHMNERVRRMFAANEALQLGYGGISRISQVCGLSRVTITKGIDELDADPLPGDRVRRVGGGRSKITIKDPSLPRALEVLVEPLTRGDPQSPLRWTCKSTRVLAEELTQQHHQISHAKVGQLLQDMNYSLQGNRKTEEGDDHSDRNAQFEHINNQVRKAMKAGCPVISVDTKKKELIGNFYNKGQQYRKSKSARKVNGHDFPDPDIPRAYPYGVYDLRHNTGFVNVGTDHDTGTFAVASIRGWWRHEGRKLYPRTNKLFITADGGGSNGYRHRLWKIELQRFADETGLSVDVCHFPPGTSKWNKVEHRLFSFISSNWRGEPLQDYETVVQLIAHTTTAKGLTVTCRLDLGKYPTGIKVTDEEFAVVNLKPHMFHGEWNYTISPRREL
jgi:hypothetical protein